MTIQCFIFYEWSIYISIEIIRIRFHFPAIQSCVRYYFSLWPTIADASWKYNKIKKSIYFPCERTCPELIQFVRPRKGWIVNEERSPNVKVCHSGKKVSNIGSSQWKPTLEWDQYLFVILLYRRILPFVVNAIPTLYLCVFLYNYMNI